ncbi:hypothetical protein [Mycolicibacterium llatzerense]|uniref:hypothetical protein n=1 Tax=Mycolicibacterium llatzerense TaxID=280871 RepID=UPI0021B66A25|nr:hypothetical protein [Mycolicibacterium llatzerense]MCT7371946.1 hypothetical protein [Mycolicibacterium llatzerense]
MTTITGDDVQCYTERDITAKTGLPGPYVADLLPHRSTPPGEYCITTPLYGTNSIELAQLANQMLRVGVRRHYIRSAVAQPMTADQIARGIAAWTALADGQPDPTAPPAPTKRPLAILAIALAAISILLLGIVAGFAIGLQ